MSKRILVVEDQEDNRQIVRDLLTANDYEMTEAENGEEALAAVAKDRPDLILMDIQLPVMDGYEATRRLKADPSLCSIPIIAVTSYALSGEAEMKRKPVRRAVMILSPSLIVRVSSWRRFVNFCRKAQFQIAGWPCPLLGHYPAVCCGAASGRILKLLRTRNDCAEFVSP
jgi:two-component system, cell cycle response regulator DivK